MLEYPGQESIRHSLLERIHPQHRLVAAVGLPGSGRTTLLRQLQGARTDAAPGCLSQTHTRRAPAERALDALLALPAETRAHQRGVIVLDDVLRGPDDPLWDKVATVIESTSALSVFVSAFDAPASGDAFTFDWQLLTDGDLYFDDEELATLLGAEIAEAYPHLLRSLRSQYFGHPASAQLAAQRVRNRLSVGLTPQDLGFLERQLASDLLSLPEAVRSSSPYLSFLLSMCDLRRFGPAEAAAYLGVDTVTDHFSRLADAPLGSIEVAHGSNLVEFAWTGAVWELLDSRGSAQERDLRHTRVLGFQRERDNLCGQLQVLLDSRRYDEADQLAFMPFNQLLQASPTELRDNITSLPEAALDTHPHLRLTACMFLWMTRGPSEELERRLRGCLHRLDSVVPRDPLEHFALLTRRMVGHIMCRDRHGAEQQVKRLHDTFAPGEFAITTYIDRHPDRASSFIEELLVLSWLLTQLDDHLTVGTCIELARSYAIGASARLVQDVANSWEGNARLLGLPLDKPDLATPFGAWPRPTVGGYIEVFDPLAAGNDDGALEGLRMISQTLGINVPPESVTALTLILSALSSRGRLTAPAISSILASSRGSWQDQRVGTFASFGATLAYLVAGDSDAAARAMAGDPVRQDGYAALAAALVHSTHGANSDAVSELEDALSRGTLPPRFAAVAEAMLISSLMSLEHVEPAAHRLSSMLSGSLDRGVLRFALRFVPSAHYAALLERTDLLSDSDRATLEEFAADPRPLGDVRRFPHLTTSEVEVLRLLRQGLTTSAIARSRVVSPNTVHTQLRRIYTKLDVRTRTGAVSVAETLGVFDA